MGYATIEFPTLGIPSAGPRPADSAILKDLHAVATLLAAHINDPSLDQGGRYMARALAEHLRRARVWAVPDGPSYTCPKCGLTSHNPSDVENRYCGNCHQFEGIH